ncbi:CBS domain-containing protein [Saccharothrix deserti]|uniref:CBS domain-containing protein n=1 Tax=Saccharothrix deserti TaxID=2593674 RepID=UPI002368797F|nr:CBS domain-containing protein [Saccharothrix deserti]
MDGYGFTIVLVAVLVLFNAVFAGSEMALISLREGQLRALEIHERRLREVLVPRRAVVTLAAEEDVASARAELAASGHSRAPVARGGHLDDVVGVVHLRDLLDDRGSVGEVVRPAVVFPDTVRVSDALRRFKVEREQMALVVDEHGAVAGRGVRLRRGSGEGQVGRDLQGDGDQGADAGGDRGQ